MPVTVTDRESTPARRATAAPARWAAAAICIFYGFAKLTGAQFTILDSELARPMGEVSGFWLAWYFFGYSPAYGTFIAMTQVVGGALLVLPRTSLLAALALVPVFANIILIDLAFNVGTGPMMVAAVALGCLLLVIAPHLSRLRGVVLLEAPAAGAMYRYAGIAIVVAIAWLVTYWSANYNNRKPTPIDGVWRVGSQSAPASAPGLDRVFFERNRAFWVTFRNADGTDVRHHFEVGADGTIQVWEQWLTKGPLIMRGQIMSADRLRLEGVGSQPGEPLLLTRQRGAR